MLFKRLHDRKAPVLGANLSGAVVLLCGLLVSFSLFLCVRFYSAAAGVAEQFSVFSVILLAVLLVFSSATAFYARRSAVLTARAARLDGLLTRSNYEFGHQLSGREEARLAAQDEANEYRHILDTINDVVFELDSGGRLVFVNDAWSSLTGVSLPDSLGKSVTDFFHEEDRPVLQQKIAGMVRRDIEYSLVIPRVVARDHDVRSVRLLMKVLPNERTKELRVVGAMTDIEERRRSEAVLREAEEKYRKIVENAVGGIYQVSMDGRCLSANPALADMLGYDTPAQLIEEMSDVSRQLYVSQADRYRFLQMVEKKGALRNFETRIRKRNGYQIWVNENARAVYDEDGHIRYFEGSMEDISARKAFEIELREAKIASDLSNRAKSEFLANMSHELRTPLNVIIGFSEIIKNQILGPMEHPQYAEYAEDVYNSGHSLLRIINEILDITRIEAGDRPLQEEIVDMDRLIQSSVSFMASKINGARIVVYNNTVEKIPQLVGEEIALKQIITNILSNAVKFTPAGGNITISHEMSASGRLRLSITDTGIGMNEYEKEKALSPFGQVEGNLNRDNSGTGLGLTLVQSLMGLHEGELELFSQKGLGTTATLIFPATRVVLPQTQAEAVLPDVSECEADAKLSSDDADLRMNEEPPSSQIH